MPLPSRTESARLLEAGVWSQNVGLVQLLGLCPLLAVSGTSVNALGLGLATLLALVGTNVAISLIRRLTAAEVRIPAFVMVIAAVVTSIELAMHALLPELHRVLGIFLPLIVTNCAILGRAEALASRVDPARALLDALGMGLGFLGVLMALGLARELIGQGSLFAGAGPLLGLPGLELKLSDHRFLIAALPPGAFVLLGLMIAARQWWLQRPRKAAPVSISAPVPSISAPAQTISAPARIESA
jgi:electron transport complex protein RnfE